MISLKAGQSKKLDILNKLFASPDIKQLTEFAESRQIISVLNGKECNLGLLQQLTNDHNALMENSIMGTNIIALRNDMKLLITAIRTMTHFVLMYSDNELSILKNKYSVF